MILPARADGQGRQTGMRHTQLNRHKARAAVIQAQPASRTPQSRRLPMPVRMGLPHEADADQIRDNFAGGRLAEAEGFGQFSPRRSAEDLQPRQESALVELPHFGRHEDHNT